MTKIEFLKYLAKGWFGNSQQHSIHAQLLKARGPNKLADKIMAESEEEWTEAKKVNARLIELGETPALRSRSIPLSLTLRKSHSRHFTINIYKICPLNCFSVIP